MTLGLGLQSIFIASETLLVTPVIVAPATRTVATTIARDPEFDQDEKGPPNAVSAIGNACGLPAVVVPSGFSEEGLPTGIELVSRAYDENAVLAVARAYQGRIGLAPAASAGRVGPGCSYHDLLGEAICSPTSSPPASTWPSMALRKASLVALESSCGSMSSAYSLK